MGLINDIKDAFRFKDTVFLKESSDLQDRYDALNKLAKEYPDNEELLSELYICKKGLDGENEIAYQLKKSNIGMYVLRDVKVKYENLTSQIDYIIVTSTYEYYVECKNLVGNITVNEKGDFIRELNINGKTIKKGMYSPLTQVEAQRDVMRKIWDTNISKFKKMFASNHFNHYRRVLVVAANHDTILNTDKAPDNIKYKILRADSLIRQIQYDINHKDKLDATEWKSRMEKRAKAYLEIATNEEVDYYNYFKEKYCMKTNNNDDLKERLIELRKNRSNEMNIPAYYVFTNEELDKLMEIRPKSIDELRSANILPDIKINIHGIYIVEEINKKKQTRT